MLDLGNTVEPLIDAVDQACQQGRQEVEAHVRLPFHPKFWKFPYLEALQVPHLEIEG